MDKEPKKNMFPKDMYDWEELEGIVDMKRVREIEEERKEHK